MGLINYTDFKDKEHYVAGKTRITNLEDIDKMFGQFDIKYKKEENKWIYRGINEAAYKMFTSSQRVWFNNSLNGKYSDYLNSLISNAKKWNDEILSKYLKSINKDYWVNNLAYFSIMQHYGLPTPLIDFTHNPYVALYFACKDVDKCYYDNNTNDIKNFFSVYFIWPGYFESKDFTKKINDIDIGNLVFGTFLIENDMVVNNNLNIIAQEGLFIVNTFPDKDLIESLNLYRNQNEEKLFGCYNIHKSLAKPLIIRLEEMGLSEQMLFPDLNKLKL